MTVYETGDLAAAERYVRQSVELCRATGAQSTLAHGLYTLSGVARLKGDDAQAHAAILESLQIAQSIGEEWLIPYILIQRSKLLCQAGEPAAALRDIDQVVAMVRQTGYRLALSTALIQRADVQWALGDMEQAGAALREGLDIATSTRFTIDLMDGVLIAARLWRGRSQASQAAEWVGLLLNRRGVGLSNRQEAAALGHELEADLGATEFAAGFERGRSLTLDAAVARISATL